MDVIILASGLGTRLSKYTHNVIPKYLINIDDNTGLYYIIKYWNNYANNIYLVINEKYNDITIFYIKNILNEYIDKIRIINYNESDGTAYTLNYLLNNELKNISCKNLLITWCDLYLINEINFDKINESNKSKNNIHIFTSGNNCRFYLNSENKIIESDNSDGNIIGIYYFQNYEKFNLKDCKYKDIVNYLDKIGNIYNYNINDIVDYGDENKLNMILNNTSKKIKCRYFNNIKIIKNKLLKTSINNFGKKIIYFEKEWYKYINSLDINFIPKIYDIYNNGFLMEYKKKYKPLYIFLLDCEKEIKLDKNKFIKTIKFNIIKTKILKDIFDRLLKIHQIKKINISKKKFMKNLKIEIYDKIYKRKKIIDNFIYYFGIIEYVNGLKIKSFDSIIKKCNRIIRNYYIKKNKYEYSIILGDCQFSNILINPNDNDIIFIDPRGYFGNYKIFGPIEYDYAKILYGISGYDNFNSNYFNIDFIKNKSIEFKINNFNFKTNYFKKVHKAFLVIIWLGLAEYNKNNIWKCLASYYYGLYLGTKII